jgi:polysaccharide export outer membrane protein
MNSLRILLILVTPILRAQPQLPVIPVEPSPNNLPIQRIGADDLVAVSVYGSPELTRTIRVGQDGYIRLPMLKERIAAKGLMPDELEESIARALEKGELIVDPYVTVTVAEYHSRPVSVVGSVRSPVTFQALGTVTLLDALARAGGLGPDAGAEILVSRHSTADDGLTTTLVQRIPVRSLIDAADPEVNVKLKRRRRDSGSGGGQDLCARKCPQAGRGGVARWSQCHRLESPRGRGGLDAVRRKAGLHLPPRGIRGQERDTHRTESDHESEIAGRSSHGGRHTLHPRCERNSCHIGRIRETPDLWHRRL